MRGWGIRDGTKKLFPIFVNVFQKEKSLCSRKCKEMHHLNSFRENNAVSTPVVEKGGGCTVFP